MFRASFQARQIVERLCRPQRVGVFGHRGVGKTTLLTMLYREAVSGRLSGFRLAAGDAATARYLGDRLLQLAAGDLPPATLAETDLRFQLYHGETRLELLMRDYQGEHVELGREEPIREFLRDCDAVWVCLEPAMLESPGRCLQAQQEVEQLVEDYLALDRIDPVRRPMAVLLTKSDMLAPSPDGSTEGELVAELIRHDFNMVHHALASQGAGASVMAVSSLGPRGEGMPLAPRNLDAPLRWLLHALRAQDAARIEYLLSRHPAEVGLIRQAIAAFSRRHAGDPAIEDYQRRLSDLVWRQRKRRGVLAASLAVLTFLGLVGYDLAAHAAAAGAADPEVALQRWRAYQKWPLKFRSQESVAEGVAQAEQAVRARRRETTLASLRQRVAEPHANAGDLWTEFKAFCQEFPGDGQARELEAAIRRRAAEQTFQDLEMSRRKGEAREHLVDLLRREDRFLEEFPDSQQASTVTRFRAEDKARLDAHDFEEADAYSREPGNARNFSHRRERYRQFLAVPRLPELKKKAESAIARIEADWERDAYDRIREAFRKDPGDLATLTALCENYLALPPEWNPDHVKKVRQLLAWKSALKSEYRVTLERGEFSGRIRRWYTRGPDLSVEVWVNGVKHGPSNIIKNHYNPHWQFEFPRPVVWKFGDQIRIKVTDHDFKNQVVSDFTSDPADRLSMRLLSGEITLPETPEHKLWFRSDFPLPPVLD